jgi:hypothetical protein
MHKRRLWQVVVFSFITIGIYPLYWLYATRKEMVNRGAKIPHLVLLLIPLSGLLGVAVAEWFVLSTLGQVPAHGANRAAVTAVLLGVLAAAVLYPLTAYWFYKYCRGVEKVTKKHMTFGVAYGLWAVLSLFFVGFIWPALVQESFNQVD